MRRVIYECDGCRADLEVAGPDGSHGLAIANIKTMLDDLMDWPTVDSARHFCDMTCLSKWAADIAAKEAAE